MNGTILRFYVHEKRIHRHIALFEWFGRHADVCLAVSSFPELAALSALAKAP